jgi:hypothetical protein|nr:MAG TPA: hypothetical protein [Caudoviricetes sp.]
MGFASRALSATMVRKKEMRTVKINQPANGSISALYNGVTYKSSFDVPDGAEVSFSCTPNSGYQFVTFTTAYETLFKSINLQQEDTGNEAFIQLTIPDGVNIIKAEITPVTPNTMSASARAPEPSTTGIYMVNIANNIAWLNSDSSSVTTVSGYIQVTPLKIYNLKVFALADGKTVQDFKANFYCGTDCENKTPGVNDSEHSGGVN